MAAEALAPAGVPSTSSPARGVEPTRPIPWHSRSEGSSRIGSKGSFAKGDWIVLQRSLKSADSVPVSLPAGTRGKAETADDEGDHLFDFGARGLHWIDRDDLGSLAKASACLESPETNKRVSFANDNRSVPRTRSPAIDEELSFAEGDFVGLIRDMHSADEVAQPLRRGQSGHIVQIVDGELLLKFKSGRQHWVPREQLVNVLHINPPKTRFVKGDFVILKCNISSADEEPVVLSKFSSGQVIDIQEGDLLVDFPSQGKHWLPVGQKFNIMKVLSKDERSKEIGALRAQLAAVQIHVKSLEAQVEGAQTSNGSAR